MKDTGKTKAQLIAELAQLREELAAARGAASAAERLPGAAAAAPGVAELQRASQLLAAQLEGAVDGVLVVDEQGRIVSFNRRFLELWRIPEAVVASRSDERALESVMGQLADPVAFRRRVAWLYEHRDETCRDEVALHDGRTFDRYSTPLLAANGQYLGRAWYFRDITDRKQTEAELICHRAHLEELVKARTGALAESEARYRVLFEHCPDVILVADARTGQFRQANPAACRFFGYTRDELLSLRVSDIHPPEALPRLLPEFAEIAQGRRTGSPEVPCRRKDGTIVYADITAAPLAGAAPPLAIGLFRDITERKRAEAALRESEDKFRHIFDHSVVAKSITAPDGQLRPNQAFCELLGYSREELARLTWQAVTHPDDVGETQQTIDRVTVGEVGAVRFTKRYLRKNGEVVWADVSTSLRRDRDGKPLYFMTTVMDITERKRAEEALRESEDKFRYIFDYSVVAKSIATPDGQLRPNQAFCDMLGYSPAELTRLTWQAVTHPDDVALCERALAPLWTGEAATARFNKRYLRRDGAVVYADTTVWVRRDTAGKPLYLVATALDITERKRAEEVLAEDAQSLLRLNRALHVVEACKEQLVQSHTEDELLPRVCAAITAGDGYRLAWVGYAEHDAAKTVRPVAHAGFSQGYEQGVAATWADTERGRGPTGVAIRTGRPATAQDILQDPAFAPWRQAARERGYASSVALPLREDGQTFGALMVYAAEPHAFRHEETQVLAGLAGDLAYAIKAVRVRAARDQAEAELAQHRAHLEELVEDRTAALAQTNAALLAENARRQSAEARLARRSACAEGLQRAGNELMAAPSPDHLFPIAVRAAAELTDLGSATLFGFTGDGQFTVLATVGALPSDLCARTSYHCLRRCARTGRSLVISDLQESSPCPGCPQVGATYDFRSCMTVPILLAGKPAALLNLRARDHGEHSLLREVAPLLEVFGHHLGLVWERLLAQEALAVTQQRLQAILDHAPALIAVKDCAGRLLLANRRLADHLGLPGEALVGKTSHDLVGRELAETYEAHDREVIAAGRSLTFEEVTEEADGRHTYLAVKFPLCDSSGHVQAVCGISTDITDRKRAEEARGLLADIVESTSDLVGTFTADGQARYLNRAARRALGLAEDADLSGRRAGDSMPAASRATVLATIRTGLAHADLWQGEFALCRANGTEFPVSAVALVHQSPDGQPRYQSIIARDISELRQADERLRLLSQAVEQSPVSVVITDGTGAIQYVNPQFVAVTGYAAAEALGQNPRILKSGEHGPEFYQAMWATLLAGQVWQGEIRNRKKNGELYWETAAIAGVRGPDGRITHYVAIKEDITARKEAVAAREAARQEADRANRAKSVFLANMSHEIRTPLNAILGFSQLLLRDAGLTARQREHLGTITRGGEHLLALINDILEMSRIEAGRVVLNPTAFDLHALLDDLASLFRAPTAAKELGLRVERTPEVPHYVVGDAGKLRQVLVNLVGNAVKFTDRGEIAVRVGLAADATAALRLKVVVADSGIGIAADDLGRLFRPFSLAGSSGQATGGTGLGLAISREFVRLMGGELTVVSELGKGSAFTFTVALEPGAAAAVDAPAPARRVVGLAAGQGPFRILAVDDHEANRQLLSELLADVGFVVREAADGAAALAVAAEWAPHLVLMDMRMPVMDGYEATRRLKATPTGRDLPVIGVTAGAFAEDRERVLAAGAVGYVRKPYHQDELFQTIGTVLGVRYRYAEEPASPAGPEVTAAAVAALPAKVRAQLLQAAREADYQRLLELHDVVATQDASLAAALRRQLERFDYAALIAQLTTGSTR